MRVLLTGGSGYLGTHLKRELTERGHAVMTCDLQHARDPSSMRCDIREFGQLERVLDWAKPELVYHLAAEFGRNNGEEYYEQCWETNVIGTKNLIRLQERHGLRVVFFSSSEVYGDYPETMTETVMDRFAIRQLNDYAISKWVGEQMVMNSEDRFGSQSVRVRLFNSYGPGEVWTPYRSMVCQFVYRALFGLPIEIYNGYHRTSTYVADTIDALANIAESFCPGEVYNIAGDENHEVVEVWNEIEKLIPGTLSFVRFLDVDAHNTTNKFPDNTHAKEQIGLRSTVKLAEGIEKTVAWAKGYYVR